MIKAIIFDIGGVLLRTQDHYFRFQWDQKLAVPPGTVEQAVFNSQCGKAAQLGKMTTAELWDWIGQHFNLLPSELSQLKRDFWAGDVLDQKLVDLIYRLHKQYQTAVISNYSDILPHLINDEWQIGDAFDVLTVSADVQVMKPDPAIYKRTLAKLEVQPQEAVFIDDFGHNIQGAIEVGMRGIHFTEGVNLTDELKKFGIKIPT